jgi:hypothetical protein
MSRYTHILAALAASALALAGPAFAGQKLLSYSSMVRSQNRTAGTVSCGSWKKTAILS